jgi:3'-phosphoadenosine 5'-phosphosulfate sulfotransferase (PAPS reductase)/FAD synthetase
MPQSAPALHVVSVSGGKDSTALYLWALEKFGPLGFLATFADTGHEHPVTLNYLKNLPLWTKGPEITWHKRDFSKELERRGVVPNKVPFLDMLLFKSMMPSGNKQFCTTLLKLEPIRDWINSLRDTRDVILYLGIRAEESARRAKLAMEEYSDFYDCLVSRPLLHWKIGEVFAMHKKHGIEPNPLYKQGMSRVGCYPCINANKSDLALLPDWAWDKIKGWEAKLGVPWFKPGLVPGIEGAPTIEEVRFWSKTERGAKNLDIGKFIKTDNDVPSCMSTWGVCD